MSQHTPGPWIVEETEDGHLIRMATAIGRPSCHAAHHVIDYDHMVYQDDGGGGQFEEAEANARLIAAAPDMYDAIRHWLSGWEQNDEVEKGHGLRMMRDAVAKAEGRER